MGEERAGGDLGSGLWRQGEMAVLAAAMTTVEAGRAAAVLVVGPRGSGRTHLLGGAADLAWRRGWRVVCLPTQRAEGGWPADGGSAGVAHPGAALAEALRASAVGPTALLVDDLHELDAACLALLHLGLCRAAWRRLLFVGALREEGPGGAAARAVVASLARCLPTRTVALAPLSPEAVVGLAERLLGGPLGPGARERLVALAGGDAGVAAAAVRAWAEEGTLAPQGGRWELVGSAALPAAARRRVRERAADLGPVARAALACLGVAGAPLGLDVLARAVGEPADRLAGLLAALQDRGLVDLAGPGVRLHEEGYAEAFAEEVPAGERACLHARLAEALVALCPGEPARAAEHLRRAGALGVSRAAVAVHLAAARAAERTGSHAAAARHLGDALDLMSLGYRADLRGPALRHLGDACWRAGEGEPARRAWSEALQVLGARAAGPEAAGLHGRLALAEWEAGRLAEAEAHLQEGLRAVRGAGDGLAAWELQAVALRLAARRGENTAVRRRLRDLLAEPPPTEDAAVRAIRWEARCTLALLGGAYRALRRLARGFVADMEAAGDGGLVQRSLDSLVRCHLTVGELAPARQALARQAELLARHEVAGLGWYARLHMAVADFLAGAWPEAEAGLRATVERAREAGRRRPWAQALALLALFAARQGRVQEAQGALAEAQVVAGGLAADRHVGSFLAVAEAALAVEAGDAERAGCAARSVRAVGWHGMRPWALALEAEAAALAGAAATAERDLQALRRLAGGGVEPLAAALAAGVEGLLRYAEGDGRSAAAALDRAARGLFALGMPAEAARWRWRAVQATRGRLVGWRCAAPRPAWAVGSPRATPREREILRLVAEGCTDREVAERLGISPHTVATHLKRLRERAGCRSRAALVRRAAHEGWLAGDAP